METSSMNRENIIPDFKGNMHQSDDVGWKDGYIIDMAAGFDFEKFSTLS